MTRGGITLKGMVSMVRRRISTLLWLINEPLIAFMRVLMPVNWDLGLALKNSWELGLLSQN